MRKSARIALSSTPPHNYRLLNGQTSSPSRGPASGHGGRPPNTGTVANLVATFNAMGGSREPRGRLPRARSPSPDIARVLFESIPKRARSGVTNPPISVGLALEHLATYGRLQPFEDRRDNGHRHAVHSAVLNIIGGPLQLHSFLQYYLIHEGEYSVKCQVAEHVAAVTTDLVNQSPESEIRIVKVPCLAKLAAFRSDVGLSHLTYRFARKHFPEILAPL